MVYEEEDTAVEKAWYESKGMWGGVVALVAGVAGAAGYALSVEEVDNLTTLITSLASGLGGLLAMYGRKKAATTIK